MVFRFVFSTLKASIEQQKNAKNVLAAPAPKGKGKSKKTTSESAVSLWDSETEKETMLTSINTLIELEISIFWRSTRPEVKKLEKRNEREKERNESKIF